MRLAIVSTHPIQYYAPVFRAISAHADVTARVFYTWSQSAQGTLFDPGFRAKFAWDIPLMDGYEHEFVQNVARIPGSHHFFGIRTPDLVHKVLEWRADAILIYGWAFHAHLKALVSLKGRVPVFFRGDSHLLDPCKPMRKIARRALLSWVYSHVDFAIAVGQNNRDYYAWCGLRPDVISFAPHSVDTDRFAGNDAEQTMRSLAWRRDLGISSEATVFLFAAKFMTRKAPVLLLDAFLSLKANAHLIFVGNGELEDELRKRSTGKANVHFLPFQNQASMPAVYRVADVFVLPSAYGETWGLAINEAMACARPVIASSRVGAARDLVRQGSTGWVFDAGDAESLRRALGAALTSSRTALHHMGQRARELSLQWSTQAAANGIVAAVLSGFPPAPRERR
jgi:glycosyltransferase involved in cell wall biosynthesis